MMVEGTSQKMTKERNKRKYREAQNRKEFRFFFRKILFHQDEFFLWSSVEVIQFPEDQNLFVGRTQTIQCSADGYPKPTFVWLKDFFEIDLANPRFNLLPNGSLLISPVHEKDRGEYVCRITQLGDRQGTSLREQEQEITVTVKGKLISTLNLHSNKLSCLKRRKLLQQSVFLKKKSKKSLLCEKEKNVIVRVKHT